MASRSLGMEQTLILLMFYTLLPLPYCVTFTIIDIWKKKVCVCVGTQGRGTNKVLVLVKIRELKHFGLWLMWEKLSYQKSPDKISQSARGGFTPHNSHCVETGLVVANLPAHRLQGFCALLYNELIPTGQLAPPFQPELLHWVPNKLWMVKCIS